ADTGGDARQVVDVGIQRVEAQHAQRQKGLQIHDVCLSQIGIRKSPVEAGPDVTGWRGIQPTQAASMVMVSLVASVRSAAVTVNVYSPAALSDAASQVITPPTAAFAPPPAKLPVPVALASVTLMVLPVTSAPNTSLTCA